MTPRDCGRRCRVLVLEPFGGGSHAAFNQQWSKRSRHELTLLELPAVHWKWRSRHSPLTLALQANRLANQAEPFDAVFCSEMLNLPEWRGFASESLRHLPVIVYFHENQFTYPLTAGQNRDYHFAYSNVLTALSADRIWFNSAYHQREFSEAAYRWLRRMPDFRHLDEVQAALAASQVFPPGIDLPDVPLPSIDRARKPIPTIGWVARWEHDKAPERFVAAIEQLLRDELPFELCLLGQQFVDRPPELQRLLDIAGSRVQHCGFVPTRAAYWEKLASIDIVVSTAIHEFYGIGIVEAVAAGARPLLPKRLAYPEVLELADRPDRSDYFYHPESPAGLSQALQHLIRGGSWRRPTDELQASMLRRDWRQLAPQYDAAIEDLVSPRS